MKKSLVLILLAAFLITLSSCSKNPADTGSDSSQTTGASSAESETVSTEEPDPSKITGSSTAPSTAKPSSSTTAPAKTSSKTPTTTSQKTSAAKAPTKAEIFDIYLKALEKTNALKSGSLKGDYSIMFDFINEGITVKTTGSETVTFDDKRMFIEAKQSIMGQEIRYYGFYDEIYRIKIEDPNKPFAGYEVVNAEDFYDSFMFAGDDSTVSEGDDLKLSQVTSATLSDVSGGRKFEFKVSAEAFDDLIKSSLEDFEGINIKSDSVALTGFVNKSGYLEEMTIKVTVNFSAVEEGKTQNMKMDITFSRKYNEPGKACTVKIPDDLNM